MNTDDLITIDPEVNGGTPVFKGTRVPIKTLFEYLENNYSFEQFLECFPSVTRESRARFWDVRSKPYFLLPQHENSAR
jgi:uncharacterized protein (DUF433 family)